MKSAITVCEQLNRRFTDYAPGWFLSAQVASSINNVNAALTCIHRALTHAPDNIGYRLFEAKLRYQKGDHQAVNQILDNLPVNQITEAHLWAELALIENLVGRTQSSAQHYQQALSLAPDNAGIHFNLASVQRYLGKLADAEEHLEKAIALNPTDAEAHLLLSSLDKQTAASNHIERLQRTLQQHADNLPLLARSQLHYALAKELEDTQQYPASFDALRQGATLKRQNMQYQPENDIATLHKLGEVFNRDWLQQPPCGEPSEEPIFILGLPRTGSTLVERILSAHSDVHSAGELNNFSLVMMAQCKAANPTPPASKLDLVERTAQLDMQQLGRAYIDSTRPDTGHTKHFIDKLPLNSLNLGLISQALPKAKLIYVKRHPMDTCYAIYKQLFTQGYPFSYDLTELANYYIAHHQLMQHWQQALGDRLLTVNYEGLVAHLQPEVERLLDYCGLPWQDACLAFYQQDTAAKTASATQVRQPVYSGSVGKWKAYAEQLAPLRRALTEAGIRCDEHAP